jgi:nicotinamide-nucleotide amidase
MHAEIIAVGDEITSGQLLDTNTQWLAEWLEASGVRVLYHTCVGDQLEAEAEVFRLAIGRADVVVATGGLGPTADDLTRPALAKAAGRELVFYPEAMEHIRGLFARRKRPMPEQNNSQAFFPAGSRMVPNPNGTAPGIDLEVPREGQPACRVFALPGVPAEMKEMWTATVAAELRKIGAGQRVIRRRKINCFGTGESQIEAMLPDLIRRGRTPTVGITASQATISLRITAEGASDEECRAIMEPTVAAIRRCLGKLIYGEDDEQLQDTVVRLLRQHNKTLATVEWGTAGLVADWLGETADAAGRFQGGVVVTNPQSFVRLLGAPPESISRHSPHSSEVAEAMALSCRARFGSDYAVAVGPFPAFDATAAEPKPAFIALATAAGATVSEFPFAAHPALLRILFAKRALDMVRLAMMPNP